MKKLFVLIGQEQRERCKAYIDTLPFGRTAVEIGPYKKGRSVPFNNYYWGFVVTPLAEFVGESPEEMHEILCRDYFGTVEKEFRGVKYQKPRRTTTTDENGEKDVLTTSAMQDYVYHCQRIAAEMGVRIETDMREAG